MAHLAGTDGVVKYPCPRRSGEQCRRAWGARHVGVLGRGRGASRRWLPSAEWRQLERQLPALAEPEITPEATIAMRKRLQPFYDAKGLGEVPEPQGAASEVSREHLAMLFHAKPQVVSFHFGLPSSEVIEAIKDAGIFIICS